jgi:integrase
LRVRDARGADLGISITAETTIFTCDLERPIPSDTVTHYVRRIAERVGVDTHLDALRHFAAAQMIGDGHDVWTVAGRLSRRDASVTPR